MYTQQFSMDEQDWRQQQPTTGQTQFYPGFPGFPGFPPYYPGPDGGLNQRVRRLEELYYRLEAEVDRLNRRVNQLERRVNRLEGGGGYYPFGQSS